MPPQDDRPEADADPEADVSPEPATRKRFNFRTDPSAEPNDTIKIIRDGLVNAHAQRARREEASRRAAEPADETSSPEPEMVVERPQPPRPRLDAYGPRMLGLLAVCFLVVGVFVGVVLSRKRDELRASPATSLPASANVAPPVTASGSPSASATIEPPAATVETAIVTPAPPPSDTVPPPAPRPSAKPPSSAPRVSSPSGASPLKDDLPPGLSP